ncbi:MAG TPA: 2-isopropylmalate synthase [Chloroflexota bacterium]|nr:2-isopropylmalate synthase [Chloroflexota bacterium]
MDRLYIFDTTLRDGEQSPGASLTSDEKLEVALQLADLGVDIVEAGFPIASPDDAAAVERIAKQVKGPVIAGLARCKPEDIDVAWESLSAGENVRLHTFISTSDIHLQKQFRMTREQALDHAVAMVKRAKKYLSDVEFSPMDATRSDVEYLFRMLEAVIDAGATTINIADTVGYTTPAEFGRLITAIRERVPNADKAVISVHCHDDLGMAVANSLAAVQAGARQVECTINGIGERAGNAALEEIVMATKTRADVYHVETRIDTNQIYKTSRLVSNLTQIVVQPNKAVVGSNAFAHESGIHTDGLIKDRSTYEIMDPRAVGLLDSTFVLGKHSGRAALRKHFEDLGYQLSDEELNRAIARLKAIADKKKEITSKDLEAILADEMIAVPELYQVLRLQVSCGYPAVPTATVELRLPNGEEHLEVATGTGPVDACYRAIARIVDLPVRLAEYSVHSVTSGIDALGEVSVRIESGGRTFHGRGADPDIIVASAKAYLNALNKAAAAPQNVPARVETGVGV